MKHLIIKLIATFFLISLVTSSLVDQIVEDEHDVLIDRIGKYYPNIPEEDREKFLLTLIDHVKLMNFTIPKPDGIIVPFECKPFTKADVKEPTSVHDVTFPYIESIAAIGDSITAGFGADVSSIFNMLTEYRGLSWSIGGDKTLGSVLTLPNLIRQYNPNLVGYSTGYGDATSKNAHCNQAISGAICKDMLGQAKTLLPIMEASPNFNTSYKMITMFIGGNDLCADCDSKKDYATLKAEYKKNLAAAVDFFHANYPKTILNVVPVIDVTELKQVTVGLCDLLHSFECSCGTTDRTEKFDFTRELQKEYVEAAAEVVAEHPADDGFAVVYQPFMANTFLPRSSDGKVDTSFFAWDCFHLSAKGHEAAAVALWNNINQKIGQKEDFWEGPKEQILCPTTSDFIWTPKNSK